MDDNLSLERRQPSGKSGAFSRGDKAVCTVTPYDNYDYGTAVTSPVSDFNTAPTARNAVIIPNPAKKADTLRCSYSYSDVDGTESGTQVAWTVTCSAGSTVSYTGATLSGKFGKGERGL